MHMIAHMVRERRAMFVCITSAYKLLIIHIDTTMPVSHSLINL